MKKIFTLFLLFITLGGMAQEEYDDLLNLLIDEKYEKLVYKAEKYTVNDKTKRDPLPYLYMSIGFFEISKISEFDEDYPKAFKNALKYAAKYKKKDKESEHFDDHTEYFDDLRKAAIIEAETFNDMEKYAKSKAYYKNLYQLDDQDAGAYIYSGVVLERMKAGKEAEVLYELAQEVLEGGCSGLTDTQMEYLKTGLIWMADYYAENGRGSEAKDWMELGMEFFEEDKEYKVTYNNL